MAPEMNGCAAAIIRMCPSGRMKRTPIEPQRLAQSKTGRSASARWGAPSTVPVPQIVRLSDSICRGESPSARRPLKPMSPRAFSGSMPRPLSTRSGMLQAEKANFSSNIAGSWFSIATSSSLVKPFASRNDRSVRVSSPGIGTSSDRAPITYLTISSTCAFS